MMDAATFFASGAVLGRSAGLSPGPLLTLVITETLRNGRRSGFTVAMAPLISDLPVIVLSISLLSGLAHFNFLMGIVALGGGIFVARLGLESLCSGPLKAGATGAAAGSVKKAVMVNLLNPHPYIFWMAVGGPLICRAWALSPACAASFVAAFYIMLVGSKIIVALLAHHSRGFLGAGGYVWTMRILGVVLLFMALLFIREGIGYIWPGMLS
jgi:threonine/homoserine/homoserine lactone efflux protein